MARGRWGDNRQTEAIDAEALPSKLCMVRRPETRQYNELMPHLYSYIVVDAFSVNVFAPQQLNLLIYLMNS